MGLRIKNTIKYTEPLILDILNRKFLSKPIFCVNNLFVFFWESDYAAKTTAGLWYEIEVKISLADFKRDFEKKVEKHLILSGKIAKPMKPNRFYYAVPKDLVETVKDLIPEYAGLLSVDACYDGTITVVKAAPLLHKIHLTDAELGLAEKFYYNYKSWKQRYQEFDEERKRLLGELDSVKSEFKSVTGMSFKEYLKEVQ